MTTLCKYPGCEYDESSHRPYARLRDGIPSASTVAECLDTGKARSFGWAASLIAATTAVHDTPRWWNLPTHLDGNQPCTHVPWVTGEDGRRHPGICRACGFLRSEFDRVWNAKATLGSHIHHMALSWARGEDVAVDDTTEPFMDALEKFHVEHRPEFQYLEQTVRYTDDEGRDYRGQFDFIDQHGLWDIKTGSYHPVEQTLQMAGYRYATALTGWEPVPRRKTPREVHVGKMPKVDLAGVLMLGADGNYGLIPLPADRAAFEVFLALRDAWSWAKKIQEWEKGRGEADDN